ncbi:MAG: hypothetical protein LBO09_00525 [Candidatus Peribacteria bacterium]|nr:hypothetical protein [Candidatus Peribacteria bacterium]
MTNETTYNTLPATYLASYPRNTRSGSLTSGTEADDLPWVAFPYAVGTDNTALRIT